MKKNNPDLNAKSRIKKSVKMSGMAFLSGAVVLGSVSFVGLLPASAAVDGPTVGLGTLESYSVLGGASVTNTGPSVINGDVGVSPGTSVTGFPPGVINGVFHLNDAHANQAQSDLVTAYNDAAGRAADASLSSELGGQTLVGGVYKADSSLGLTGTVTLDGQNNPNSVFIFQVGSELTTATSSSVELINGASACNVFWQVGSSATVGTASTFKGNIMALTSITAVTGADFEGRALARNGSVTLDTNTFTAPACDTDTPTEPPVIPEPVEPAPGDGSTPVDTPTTPVDSPVTPGDGSTPGDTPTTPVDSSIPVEAPPVPNDSTIPLENPDVPNDSSIPLENPPADTTIPTDSSTGLERTPGDSSTPTTRTTDDSSLTLANTGASSNNMLYTGIAGLMLLMGFGLLSSNRIASKFSSRKH